MIKIKINSKHYFFIEKMAAKNFGRQGYPTFLKITNNGRKKLTTRRS